MGVNNRMFTLMPRLLFASRRKKRVSALGTRLQGAMAYAHGGL